MDKALKSPKPKLLVDWATHKAADFACKNWHYSKCLPSTMQKRFAVGAWEDGKFIGVIVFWHGANPSIGKPYGLTIYQCCELTRVALGPHKIEVSRIISIAIKFLRQQCPGIKLIVSYADTGQGHHGGIYQATNWIYVGLTKGVPRLFFNGKQWHAKALRTSFPGLKHSDPRVKKMAATDKHKYLMPLDDQIRKQVQLLSKPYPKRAVSKDNVAPEFHSGEGGVNPTTALQSDEANGLKNN